MSARCPFCEAIHPMRQAHGRFGSALEAQSKAVLRDDSVSLVWAKERKWHS